MIKNFELKFEEYEKMRKKGYGIWYCKTCDISAEEEHNKPECHLCTDWSGCNSDCTLSRIYCTKCNISENI